MLQGQLESLCEEGVTERKDDTGAPILSPLVTHPNPGRDCLGAFTVASHTHTAGIVQAGTLGAGILEACPHEMLTILP